ncbi:flagellar protein FlgN [Magnetospirillum sp. SS-4]|uniref:flagellar protein FlgN n=1 Tax=Magnetospirillum sp. SS-4 TaxID=2681465 RepID=UPI00137E28E7|nr:flagellar protein FlgN [Magnetospirillum sp. SS-4]CAA7623186.1 conserved hypothetical protein [Magnetospirillum sp. SS-4]
MTQMNDSDHDNPVDRSPIIPFDDLIFACTNLCELLEIENEALASHDPETVKAVLENKSALARLYEQSMQPMITSPELAETLEPEQREELLAVGLRLKEQVEINAMRLMAEIESYQRVMDILATTSKAQSTTTSTYGRAGTFDSPPATGSSISFNKSL